MSTAPPDGSEPLRAGADPVDRAGTRYRIPREPNGPPSWRRRGAVCEARIAAAQHRKPKASGVEAVEAAPGPRRHGWTAEALSFAQHSRIDDAHGAGQPPQPGQPEQSARPEGEGRHQVR